LKSQIALIQTISELSRTIDSRQLRKFTIVQQTEIRQYSEIKLLYQRLQLLRKIFRDYKRSISNIQEIPLYYKYQKIYLVYRNAVRRYKQALLKKIIARYKIKQSVIDIQQQLNKLPITEEKKIKTADYIFVERVRIIETLFIFAIDSLKKKCQKKETAVNILTALCRLQKNYSFRRRKNSSIAQIVVQRPSLLAFFSIEYSPTQYIFCLDNKALPARKHL